MTSLVETVISLLKPLLVPNIGGIRDVGVITDVIQCVQLVLRLHTSKMVPGSCGHTRIWAPSWCFSTYCSAPSLKSSCQGQASTGAQIPHELTLPIKLHGTWWLGSSRAVA